MPMHVDGIPSTGDERLDYWKPKGTCDFLFGSNILGGSSGAGVTGYKINQSCRCNDDDSAHTKFTQSVAGDQTKYTNSGWVKLGSDFSGPYIWGARTSSTDYDGMQIGSGGKIGWVIRDGSTVMNLVSTKVFRDPAAWYHVVASYDSTPGTPDNTSIKIFINGVQITDFDTETYPSQNQASAWNDGASAAGVGALPNLSSDFFDGYIAEFIHIDGQALDANSFGEFDADGHWVPTDPSGLTFGDEGFWWDFAVAPGTGNGAGTDVSGNANHGTDSGLAANDQVPDSPTDDADNDVGNYCVLNSLWDSYDGVSPTGLGDGNLVLSPAAVDDNTFGTISFSSGKFYMEFTWDLVAGGGNNAAIGFRDASVLSTVSADSHHIASSGSAPSAGIKCLDSAAGADAYKDGVDEGQTITEVTNGDVMMLAVDADNGKIWYGINGTWDNSGDPGAGTGEVVTSITTMVDWVPWVCQGGSASNQGKITCNFGQQTFVHTIPTGFKPLCTAHMAAPTITDPTKYFQNDAFTGTGAELARVLTDAAGAAVSPDMVWIKDRDTSVEHVITDSVRGATKEWNSDSLNAESTVAQGLKSFDASGFTLGTDTNYNASSSLNIAWCWVEDATAGFDIVTYTGNATNRVINHGLTNAPDFIIVKNMSVATEEGTAYHASLGATKALELSGNIAPSVSASYWNDTAPTSSQFTVGTSARVNGSGHTMLAYLFEEIEGFSKFGSYSGNGNADGPFIWCGFRPAWVLIRRTDSADSWLVWDAARDTYNVVGLDLAPDTTGAEDTVQAGDELDFLSNGFKIRSAANQTNNSAGTYVFAAFAEAPFGGAGVAQARAR